MYQSLDLFTVAGDLARHAGASQATVARNLANADTPGYRAQELPSFSEIYSAGGDTGLRMTRAGHLPGSAGTVGAAEPRLIQAEASPNGNTVSVEEQMITSVEVAREHSRALTIYRHAMTVLRTSLGRN